MFHPAVTAACLKNKYTVTGSSFLRRRIKEDLKKEKLKSEVLLYSPLLDSTTLLLPISPTKPKGENNSEKIRKDFAKYNVQIS